MAHVVTVRDAFDSFISDKQCQWLSPATIVGAVVFEALLPGVLAVGSAGVRESAWAMPAHGIHLTQIERRLVEPQRRETRRQATASGRRLCPWTRARTPARLVPVVPPEFLRYRGADGARRGCRP